MNINKDNYKDFPGDVLADMIHDNQAQIIETSAEVIQEIMTHIISAIAGKKILRKRVEALETEMIQQKAFNEAILKQLKDITH